MTKILIPKFYFALCISEQFGCIASAAYCTELIDFKNNRNCAVTEEFWLPTLLIFVMFCSFCGLLDETALLQLAVSLGLAAAHVQARTAGNGGGRAVPCGADEDQLIVLAAVGAELSHQVSTSISPSSKLRTEEEFADFTRSGFGERCSCLPGQKSGSLCDFSWSWQSFRHTRRLSLIRNYPPSPGESRPESQC